MENSTIITSSVISAISSVVEALATVAAAVLAGVIVFRELPKLREEATARRIEGFKYAMEVLESEHFLKSYEAFNHLMDVAGAGHQQRDLPSAVQGMLKSLDVIGFLIEKKYIEENFFFGQEGLWLGDLGERVSLIEHGVNLPSLEYQRELYPRGRDLLNRAEQWRTANQQA